MTTAQMNTAETDIVSYAEYALEHDEFIVMYQPKFDTNSLEPVGAEALVRWSRPDGKLISPADFIPIFEKHGYIIRLDFFVLEKTCQMLRRTIENGTTPLPVSVNFSRLHIHTCNFAEKVHHITQLYQIPSKLIEIEFTETAFIRDLPPLNHVIDDLHALGYTVAMDDFGTGSSTLHNLMNLKIDVLKIDRAFLKLSEQNQKRAGCIIQAIMQMAYTLGIRVVAEGVEDENALRILTQCGCNVAQGYFYSKPINESHYNELLKLTPAIS